MTSTGLATQRGRGADTTVAPAPASSSVGSLPPFALVGRDRERAALDAHWARVQAGRPGVLVVAGETGVGKTSLLQDLQLRVRERDEAQVLVGGCVPLAGESLPFAPVLQALRALRDLPHRSGRQPTPPFDWLQDGFVEDGEPREAVLSSTTQLRMFDGLLSTLAAQAEQHPVLVAIEDLHWADRSTLELLAFLSRNLTQEALLLLVTVRSDDVPKGDPLRPWLAELSRVPSVSRLDLGRLDREATEEQLAQLLGTRPDPVTSDLVFSHSAGNPMLTAALLPWTRRTSQQAAGVPPEPIPESLHDLMAHRVSGLEPQTRQPLEVMAVVGGEVELELLAELVEQDEADVEDALAAAVERLLVEAGSGAAYRFTHPLLREVLYADLPPGRRRRLHQRAGQALSTRHRTGSGAAVGALAETARHWELGGVADQAFAARVRAGLEAERGYAFADADLHLSRAVALAPERSEEEFAALPVDRVGLEEHAAQAAHLIGDATRAVALAATAAEQCTDPVRRARLLERRGTYCLNAGLAEEAERSFSAALELLPETAAAERAQVLAGLGLLTMAWSRHEEADRVCREAIRLATVSGALREEGRALNALGVVTAYRGDVDQGIEHLRRSLAIAEQVADPDDLAAAYIDLAHVLGISNRFDEAKEVCRRGYAEMQRVGLARQEGSFLRANAAESLSKAGRWQEAEALVTEALASGAEGLRLHPVLVEAARLALFHGDLAASAAHLERLRELLATGAPTGWQREAAELEADLALWQGAPDRALAVVQQTLELVSDTDEQQLVMPLVTLGLRAAADLAEDRRAQGCETRELTTTASRLAEHAARLVPDGLRPTGHRFAQDDAVAATALAELARAHATAERSNAWSTAAVAWERVGHAFPALYARYREAESIALTSTGPGAAPVRALRAVHARASELGARRVAEEVERLATWRRVDLEPQPASPGAAAGEVDQLGPPLTAREREVLTALVEGQTNREIAESLFISTKTASVHVSNILRKLGVTTRHEAARAGHRMGLLDR